MEEKILKILNDSRSIMPTEAFRERLRSLITLAPQKRLSLMEIVKLELAENLKFGVTLALASVLIFAFLGGFNYWKNNVEYADLSGNPSLEAEAEKLNFRIQLGEAEYFTDSAQEIAAILKDINSTEKNSGITPINEDQIIF